MPSPRTDSRPAGTPRTTGAPRAVGTRSTAAALAADDTQSPTQGVDAGPATPDIATRSFTAGTDAADRPPGAGGTSSERPRFDPLHAAGPVVGLLEDGPSR